MSTSSSASFTGRDILNRQSNHTTAQPIMNKILILSLVLCACALTNADQPVVFPDTQDVNSEVEVLPQLQPATEEARDIDFNIGFGNRPAYGYRPYGYRPYGYGYRPYGYGYRPSSYGYRPYGYRPYGGAYYG